MRALEELLGRVRGPVYNLALRFLWDPDEAEDAAQEILLKITTHLHTFRGRALFSTWAYRVAANYLIDVKRSRAEERNASFERVAATLRRGSREPDFVTRLEGEALAEEVKTACTHAMLLCLNREERLAFIVGHIIGLSGAESAYVLAVNAPVFRKRLSRAREAMREFLGSHCGLMDSANACRCERRIAYAGRAFAPYLHFAGARPERRSIPELGRSSVRDLERLAAIYRTNPERKAPAALLRRIRTMLRAGAEWGAGGVPQATGKNTVKVVPAPGEL